MDGIFFSFVCIIFCNWSSCLHSLNGVFAERPRAASQTIGLNYNLRKDLSGKNQASPGFYFDPATGTFKSSLPPLKQPVPTAPSKYKPHQTNSRIRPTNKNSYQNPLLASTLYASNFNGQGDLFGNINFDSDSPKGVGNPKYGVNQETAPVDDYEYLYYDEEGEAFADEDDETDKREIGSSLYKNSRGPQITDSKEAAESIIYHSFNNPEDVILPTSSNSYLKDHYSKYKKVKTYDYTIGEDYVNDNVDGKDDNTKNHRIHDESVATKPNFQTYSPTKKKSTLTYDYTIGEDYSYVPFPKNVEVSNNPRKDEIYQIDEVHQYATTSKPFSTTKNYKLFTTNPTTKRPVFDKAYVFPTRKFPIFSVRPTTATRTTPTKSLRKTPLTTAPIVTTWSPRWHPNAAETYNKFEENLKKYSVTNGFTIPKSNVDHISLPMSWTKTVSTPPPPVKLAMKLSSGPKSSWTCSLSQSLFPVTVIANASKTKSTDILITQLSFS